MADNKTAVTVGRYTDFAVFDKADFDQKMRAGYSFDQYMIDEKNHGFRIAIGPNQAAKNKFQVYVYHVDGREYYKVNPIPVSWDIRAGRKGNAIGVRFDPLNPYDAVIDKSVNSSGYQVSGQYNDSTKKLAGETPILIAFILSLFSIAVSLTGAGVLLSIASIIILMCSKAESGLRKPAMILAIVGIVLSVISVVVWVVMFFGYIFY